MTTLDGILREIGSLGDLNSPAEVAAAIGLLELATQFLPEPAGRLASIGLLLARDQALAGKGPEDLEALRASVRNEWQAELDRRFPNG
jgi:hypothetical protein